MSHSTDLLARGELRVLGRIRSASNATLLCEAELDGATAHCVYKPIAGEAPLWDFPDGVLAGREFATYLISRRLGWNLVPHTVLRDGPAGPGMAQLWIHRSGDPFAGEAEPAADPGPDPVDLFAVDAVPDGYLPVLAAYDPDGNEVLLAHADDPDLRRMAVFDVLVNNADRKGGHVLRGVDGRLYGVDHGLCLHAEDKLRTVLWGWAGRRVDDADLAAVAELAEDSGFGEELAEHLTDDEVAALAGRVAGLLENPVLPGPEGRRRPIPWPAF
ncbi:SCO1664 family protein [Mycolicibacterium brumae]|uniref:Phosphatidylinositol kinase n=1 Tax=Mycolicibacterium brumae TaxID=85968 RepID=A0A2G5P656_9MYCO|nr:SCO1664 family protein [Mycolicibacterium brumae]MCV7193011.1 SCO1664 family protein [Mycolicibacterium brumae]PIB73849.1 phosphatidylinositol kinase [Mycolicibacterium brumae]RWA23601.1 hypothetical protein MBRU_01875 [Mycolicibacterium brumae DSM 44177]UWW08470.1 SCO1664 family protein [Mycolicibacterium brumae]